MCGNNVAENKKSETGEIRYRKIFKSQKILDRFSVLWKKKNGGRCGDRIQIAISNAEVSRELKLFFLRD